MAERSETRPQTSKTWNAVEIRCPFFKRHSTREIRCEGVMERTSNALLFERVRDKAFYQRTYCEGRYECCEHYQLLMANKYDE